MRVHRNLSRIMERKGCGKKIQTECLSLFGFQCIICVKSLVIMEYSVTTRQIPKRRSMVLLSTCRTLVKIN